MLVVAVCIGGFTAATLKQDINFDLINYHYHNPYSFLNERFDQDIAVGELESYMNPLLDVPGYLLISNVSPRQAAFGLGLIQGLNIFLIFEICILLFRRSKLHTYTRYIAAAAVAIFSFFCASNWSEVGSTMGDNIASIFALAALLLFLIGFDKSELKHRVDAGRLYRLAGFFVMGLGTGIKLTNVIYAVALVSVSLCIGARWTIRLREFLINGIVLGLGILTTGGFWFIKLWQEFKNPLFPFYNGIFKSEYYHAVNFEDVRWVPKSIGQVLFAPFSYTHTQAISSEIPFRDPRLAVLYVLLAALGGYFLYRWVRHKKGPAVKDWSRTQTVFCLFLVVSYTVWASKFSYYRYALPLELLSLSGIAVVVVYFVKNTRISLPILLVGFVVITKLTVPMDWGRVPWQTTYFGVTKETFAHLDNGTVLIPGVAPWGFVVPYFPENVETIRVESDLSSPTKGTTAMQNLMRSKVDAEKRSGARFFALKADEEAVHSEVTLNQYGFATQTCTELPVHFRQASPLKYRLCELRQL